MPNVDRPNGFTPVRMLEGGLIPTWTFPITSAGANIFVGDLMLAMATGDIDDHGTAGSAVDQMIGAVTALYDENMTSIGHPNSTVATKYLPSGDTGFAKIGLCLPGAIFRCQTSGTIAETARFANADHVVGTGSTVTAQSAYELNASTSTAAQFTILDKVDEPDNAWGLNVDLLVIASEGYWFDATAGV